MDRIFILCLQLILINNSLAQFGPNLQTTQNTPINQDLLNTPIPKQKLLNYLLSSTNQASLPEKIDILTSAVQNIPSRRTNYQVDIFKQSALQNLRAAASFCDNNANQVLNNLTPNTVLDNLTPKGLPLSPQRSVVSLIEYAIPQLRQPGIGRKVVVANEPLLLAKEPLLVANDISLLSKSVISAADYLPHRVCRFLI